MRDLPWGTQLIGGRARTQPQACLTPKAGQRPQQGPEPKAQADTLTFMLQVQPPVLAGEWGWRGGPASLPRSLPGEGRLCWLLTEG